MTAAIVLAAGRSQRYGRANKLLEATSEGPLIAHVLDVLAAAPVHPIVLVVGADRCRVARIARRRVAHAGRLRIVPNAAYRDGMASSLRTGLSALPPYCSGALVCLADTPGLDTSLIRRLLIRRRPGVDVIRPRHDGVPGHPVYLSPRLIAALDDLSGDQGAQPIIRQVSAHRRCEFDAGAGAVRDIDTPRALRRFLTASPRGPKSPR